MIFLLTGDHEDFLLSLNQSIPTHDFVDRLKDFPVLWKIYNYGIQKISDQYFEWIDDYNVNVTRILWKTGFCYTFNFPNVSKLLNIEK